MRGGGWRRGSALITAVAGAVPGLLGGAAESRAAAPLWSFETLYNDTGAPDPLGTRPDNFHPNGGGPPGITVTQDTIGATDGAHSLKWFQTGLATFQGALTDPVPAGVNATTNFAIGLDL